MDKKQELLIQLRTLVVYSSYSDDMKNLLINCYNIIESQDAEIVSLKCLLTKILSSELGDSTN